MKVTAETAQNVLWPTVKDLITATLAPDEKAVRRLIVPRSQVAHLVDLFDLVVLDILLKTIFERQEVALAQVIEADEGRFVYLEFVWINPEGDPGAYSFLDAVTVKMRNYRKRWRIVEINPSTQARWLNSATARELLLSIRKANDEQLPQEAWILPIALLGGATRLEFRPNAFADDIEAAFLPAMQDRGYGATTLANARRMWQDFKKKAAIKIDGDEIAWAAAVEHTMSEMALVKLTPAATAKFYALSLADIASRLRHIRQTLKLKQLDPRYSPIPVGQVEIKQPNGQPDGEQPPHGEQPSPIA